MNTWDKVVKQRADDLRARKARGETMIQVPTGIADLDKYGGLELGILTVIAGHTGDGKSILKLHLMEHAARSGLPVLVIDFEDPAAKTADRSLSAKTGLAAFKIGRLNFDQAESERLALAADEIQEWGKRITHVAGLQTAAAVKKIMADNPQARLVMVDYAQALPTSGGMSLERVIAELSWDLNIDAQKNNRAVVLFSQVKREVEDRGQAQFARTNNINGYRPGPGKSDLQWSSAMGDRAKALWYIFRPGRWARKHGQSPADNTMEIIVDKANFGKEGLVVVGFDGELGRIYNRL